MQMPLLKKLELKYENLKAQFPKGQASGEDITINDSSNLEFDKFKVLGNSYQETSEASENILDLSVIQDETKNDIILKKQTNNTLSLNGTSTEQTIFTSRLKKNIINSNNNYVLQIGKISGTISTGTILIYLQTDDNKASGTPMLNANSNKGEVSLNITDEYSKIVITISNGAILDNVIIYLQVVPIGTKEYIQFSPTMPSLNYPSEIESCGDNVNLLNYKNIIGDTLAVNDMDYIYSKQQTQDTRPWNYEKCDWIEKLEKGIYTLSVIFQKQATVLTTEIRIFQESNHTQEIKVFNTLRLKDYTETQFEVTEAGNVGFEFKLYEGVCKIKLEKGTVATPYSKYNEGNINFTISNKNLADSSVAHEEQNISIPVQKPFRAIDNYRDTFVQQNGKWYERHIIDEHVITGNEKVQFFMSGDHPVFILTPYPNVWDGLIQTSGRIPGKCNMFNVNLGFDSVTAVFQRLGDARIFELYFFNIAEDFEEDADLFKNKLQELYNSGNPMYFTYRRDEPELIECTEEQTKILNSLVNLHTYKGTTHIFSEDEVSPVFEIEYTKDLEIILKG